MPNLYQWWVVIVLVASSGGLFYLSHRLHRWERTQLHTHQERIAEFANTDTDAYKRELERFHNDRRIDRAIDGMILAQMLGIVLLGLAVWVGGHLLVV